MALLLPENKQDELALLEKIEEILLEKTLKTLEGNQLRTSKLLGLTRNTIRKRLLTDS